MSHTLKTEYMTSRELMDELNECAARVQRADSDLVMPVEEEALPPLIEVWNATGAECPAEEGQQEKLVNELFEAQVEKTPNAVAVVFEEEQLSYGELNAQANRLAHHLRRIGGRPDARVAICLERSLRLVASLLAVLKAGGAYVPLDPTYPPERLIHMLEDSAPAILITNNAGLAATIGRPPELPILNLDSDGWQWTGQSDLNPQLADIGLDVRNLAYIIYTSGSTGLPKGVMVEHRGLCNLAPAQIRDFSVDSDSRVLQFASLSFDASISELMMALCCGAALVLPPPGSMLAGAELLQAVNRHNVTHTTLPPAILSSLHRDGNPSSLRVLIVAGEAVSADLARCWSSGRRMINAYGPTEATVCATLYNCRENELRIPPIGRPIANTQAYILDANQQSGKIGVCGEIYVGGVGVARGYLNRAELTAERFLPAPFSPKPGARFYKTGDLGRWLPEGAIEFLGRNDFQVKIRGLRVELGEIEARLTEHASVRESVIVAGGEDEAGKRLTAYYTGEEIGAEALRAHLSSALPAFMVPAAYVYLESMPLTPNGKLDRLALPAPDAESRVRREYEPPVGEIEIKLAQIWADLLMLEKVGRQDNFFELGGHSLLAILMVERMRLEGLTSDLRTLITAPTLQALAGTIGGESLVESDR